MDIKILYTVNTWYTVVLLLWLENKKKKNAVVESVLVQLNVCVCLKCEVYMNKMLQRNQLKQSPLNLFCKTKILNKYKG